MLLHNLNTTLSEPLDCMVFRALWQKQRNAHMTMTMWLHTFIPDNSCSNFLHVESRVESKPWRPQFLLRKTINKATGLKCFLHLRNVRIKLESSEGPVEENPPLAVIFSRSERSSIGACWQSSFNSCRASQLEDLVLPVLQLLAELGDGYGRHLLLLLLQFGGRDGAPGPGEWTPLQPAAAAAGRLQGSNPAESKQAVNKWSWVTLMIPLSETHFFTLSHGHIFGSSGLDPHQYTDWTSFVTLFSPQFS